MDDKEEIIRAIGDLKKEVAVLEQRYEDMSKYIFHDLKPDIEKLCEKVEKCTENATEGYHKNFKWIAATAITSIIAIVGWAVVMIMVV